MTGVAPRGQKGGHEGNPIAAQSIYEFEDFIRLA